MLNLEVIGIGKEMLLRVSPDKSGKNFDSSTLLSFIDGMVRLQSRIYHPDMQNNSDTPIEGANKYFLAINQAATNLKNDPDLLAREVQTILAKPSDQLSAARNLYQGQVEQAKTLYRNLVSEFNKTLVKFLTSPTYLQGFNNQNILVDSNLSRALVHGNLSLSPDMQSKSKETRQVFQVFKTDKTGNISFKDLEYNDPPLTREELSQKKLKKTQFVIDDVHQRDEYFLFNEKTNSTTLEGYRIVGSLDISKVEHGLKINSFIAEAINENPNKTPGAKNTENEFSASKLTTLSEYFSTELQHDNLLMAIKTDNSGRPINGVDGFPIIKLIGLIRKTQG
jgi:hypothetical protein